MTEEHGRPLIDTLSDALAVARARARARQLRAPARACAELCQPAARQRARPAGAGHQPRAAARGGRDRLAGAAARRHERPTAPRRRRCRLFAQRAAASAPGFTLTQGQRGHGRGDLPGARRHAAGHRAGRRPDPRAVRGADPEPGRRPVRAADDRATARAAPRQRTLRATIDWSHDLLTEPEQVLLRRLSVFAGWSLDMAEEVCADELVPPGAACSTRWPRWSTSPWWCASPRCSARPGSGCSTRSASTRRRSWPRPERRRGCSTGSATTRSASPSGTSPWAWRSCPRPGGTGWTCSAGTTWTRATSGWCSASAWPTATWRPGCGSAPRSARACWCAASSRSAASGSTPSSPGRRRPVSTRGSGDRRSSGAPSCRWRATRRAPSRRRGPGLALCRAAGDEFWTAAGLNLLSEIVAAHGPARRGRGAWPGGDGDRRGGRRRLEQGLGARHPRRHRGRPR